PTFQAILGRPWIQQTLGIASTIHQSYKFPFGDKVLRVRSVPQVTNVDMISVENLPQLKLKGPMVSILEVGNPLSTPIPHPRTQPQPQENWRKARNRQAWKIMEQMGYHHGMGLGKNNQGITELVLKPPTRGEGLGYVPTKKPHKPLTWKLHDHFERR